MMKNQKSKIKNQKFIFKIIAVVLIQAFLLVEVAWCGDFFNDYCTNQADTLAPSLGVADNTIKNFFKLSFVFAEKIAKNEIVTFDEIEQFLEGMKVDKTTVEYFFNDRQANIEKILGLLVIYEKDAQPLREQKFRLANTLFGLLIQCIQYRMENNLKDGKFKENEFWKVLGEDLDLAFADYDTSLDYRTQEREQFKEQLYTQVVEFIMQNFEADQRIFDLVIPDSQGEIKIFDLESLKHADRFALLASSSISNLRHVRLIDVCKMRAFGYPLPKVDPDFHENKLRGDINMVIVSEWTTKNRWSEDLLAILEGVLRTQGINLMIVSPHAPVFIYENSEGVPSLTISEGLLYDQSNNLVLARFRKPLDVHYVWNLSGENARKFQEMGIPINASREAIELLKSKIRTQTILKDAGIRVPQFMPVKREEYSSPAEIAALTEKLQEFIEENQIEKFVVKPSEGGAGYGVTVYPAHRDAIYAAAYEIYQKSQDGDVIIENYIEPFQYKADGKEFDWNLRVFVGRDVNGDIKVNGYFVRAGKGVVNISLGAEVKKWSDIAAFLDSLFLTGKVDAVKLKEEIERKAVAVYKSLDEHLKRNSDKGETLDGNQYGVTDSLAVDFLFADGANRQGNDDVDSSLEKVISYVGEVNEFYGGQYDWDKLYPDRKGEVVENHILRAAARGAAYRRVLEDLRKPADNKPTSSLALAGKIDEQAWSSRVLALGTVPARLLKAELVYNAFSVDKSDIQILGQDSAYAPIRIEGYDAKSRGKLLLLIYKGQPVAVLRENKIGYDTRYRFSIGFLAEDFRIEKSPACEWIRDNFSALVAGVDNYDINVKGMWSTAYQYKTDIPGKRQREFYGLGSLYYFRGVFSQGSNSTIPMINILRNQKFKSGRFKRVLDVACGAGALSLAALEKLDPESIVVADADAFALLSTMINFERRGKKDKLKVIYGCLKEQSTWDRLAKEGDYGYVLFNGPFPVSDSDARGADYVMYDQGGVVKSAFIENIASLIEDNSIAQVLSDKDFRRQIEEKGFVIRQTQTNAEGLHFYVIDKPAMKMNAALAELAESAKVGQSSETVKLVEQAI